MKASDTNLYLLINLPEEIIPEKEKNLRNTNLNLAVAHLKIF